MITFLFFLFNLGCIYWFWKTVQNLDLRVKFLERQPKQVPTFKAPQPVQESPQEGRPEKQTRATETDIENASYSWDVNYRK